MTYHAMPALSFILFYCFFVRIWYYKNSWDLVLGVIVFLALKE